MFRRKAETLPMYAPDAHISSAVDEDEKESSKKRINVAAFNHIKCTLIKYSSVLIFVAFLVICMIATQLYSSSEEKTDEFGRYLLSDFETYDEENETTMEDIMKRHPYNLKPDGGNHELKYHSTILNLQKRPRTEEDEYGNIVFFSFHGRVGSSSLLSSLHTQYGFQDGGNFNLSGIHNNTMSEDKWGRHDASENSDKWQANIIERIERTFNGYGSRNFRRKVVHVRMIDAWKNDVSISWLIEALRDLGGVTHMVVLIRNPLRAKISDIAETRFRHIITPDVSCTEQKFLYDISRSEAIEMAVSQHSGIQEALSVSNIQTIGFTYEHDIRPNHLTTLHAIARFVWDDARGAVPEPIEVRKSMYQTQHGDCSLSKMIHNFNELHCTLSKTSLGWMVDSDGTYTYEKIMQMGDDFRNWVNEKEDGSNKRKLLNQAVCRVKADHADVMESTLAIRKHSRICGHGGHSAVCGGYGAMKSFMCSRLLALTNGQCDSFTYTAGNCYLHDETKSDYWEGECESSAPSFHAYLRFPEDR